MFISNKINNGKEKGVIVEVKGQKASVLIPELAMITQVKLKSKVADRRGDKAEGYFK